MSLRQIAAVFIMTHAVASVAAESPLKQTEENSSDALVLDEIESAESSFTAGAAAATETSDEEESPGRFVPTEQISQDLGVSFPVDI